MAYGGVNFLAVLIATVAAMAAGAVWYTLFARGWMAANGFTVQDLKDEHGNPKSGKTPYLVAAVAKGVMAYGLAKLLAVLDAVSVWNGIAAALFLWLAFVVPPHAVNHRFQLKPWSLTAIDAGYWLAVLVVQAVVIGLFGVPY